MYAAYAIQYNTIQYTPVFDREKITPECMNMSNLCCVLKHHSQC